ncbi:MAG: SUMF1/EgtB/PvdO family nonheme iron enzyme [Spirulinaceae cyanobacterium]
MKLLSINSKREAIAEALQQCREQTIDLFADLDAKTFCQQAHGDFSPVGWHLGHIAYTEAYWILAGCAKFPTLYPQYQRLFAADGLPKVERQNLPSYAVIKDYLDIVREKVLTYLTTAPLEEEERLWYWLIQHECQHNETIIFILKMLRGNNYYSLNLDTERENLSSTMVKIPEGKFMMGSNCIEAQDNERPAQEICLDSYWMDTYPVTCSQYQEFINAGGYQNCRWWSKLGWQWLQTNPVKQPLYWSDELKNSIRTVCGISWYEADAYARFLGKRLPTEAEWEKAAMGTSNTKEKPVYPWGEDFPQPQRCNHNNLRGETTPVNAYPQGKSKFGCYDLLGNVWEWTNTWFDGYEGFTGYPYPGYSQTYFDGQHRVLKGGSWATRPWALRNSFRNWYHPNVRQILAGFRCAKDFEH